MKNLHVVQTNKVKLDAHMVGLCIDADNKRFFLLTEEVNVFQVHGDQQSLQQVRVELGGEKSLGISTIKRDDVVLIEYIVESGSICVVLKTGQFVRIGVSTFSPPSGIVYTHNREICSVKLAPDQDLIAIADVDNEISILTSNYNVIHTSNALSRSDSAHKPVGVGWGSKETQFFGLDGRPSKEKAGKDQVVLSSEELSEVERVESSEIFLQFRRENELNTTIDWRGDGQLLATLTFIQDCDKFYLKVWNRNLELQYMSDQLVTMERGLLSWIPNGQYVCTAQRRHNRVNEVAMFEKNGMVHQRITLPTFIPHLYIKSLLWSPDSAILAIIGVQFNVTQNQVQQRHMIMLYTMQNFHYYLKYSSYLTFGGDHYSLQWDPNHNNILYISSEDGSCIEYNCTTLVDYCHEDTMVAVVDANKILLTPFTSCNIPPPMSATIVELNALINRIVVASKSFEQMLVITTDNKLVYRTAPEAARDEGQVVKIVKKIESDAIQQFNKKLGSFQELHFERSHDYQNLTLIDRDSFIATRRSRTGSEIVRLSIDYNPASEPVLDIKVLKVIPDREVVSVVKDSFDIKSNSLQLLLDDFSCNLLDLSNGEVSNKFVLKTADNRLYIRETQYIERFDKVLTLTLDLTLRSDDYIVASNCCTSFRTTHKFLIYTTNDHTIHFIPLEHLTTEVVSNSTRSWNQPIENGGTLITASESDSKVILQMPRGNLEILNPRIMVLLRISNHLELDEFLNAFMLARRYRVDLNFLADYLSRRNEAASFSEKLEKFAYEVAQRDPALLNLFITELNSNNATLGRYSKAMQFLPAENNLLSFDKIPPFNKVNKICSTIKLPSDSRYLQPTILCLIKQEPRRTDEALRMIHKMVDKEERQAALKFMLYFISIEQLFVDALATYDTDIALMVVSVSSKDPKEYLALLDSFNEIENIHLRRYKMDYHIKNYEQAFTNLLIYLQDSPDKEATKAELLDIVTAKRIYRHAITTCFDQFVNFVSLGGQQCKVDRTFEELSIEIWISYGDYLLEKRYYLEAGLAYTKSITPLGPEKRLDNAIKCFLLASDWERCVALLRRHKMSKKEATLKKISNSLLQLGEFTPSILVMGAQKNDEIAFELVPKGSWYLAELIVTDASHERLRVEIGDAINTEYNNQMGSLQRSLDSAREQHGRFIKIIWAPPKADNFDIDNCYNADSLSTVDGSEATSTILSERNSQVRVARSGAPSIKTRASTKSNKSQVTKQRKINLKVGSRHEDLALVIELKKFVAQQKSIQKSVRDLLAAQIDFMNLNTLDKRHTLINKLVKQNHDFAKIIRDQLWPTIVFEGDYFSVYKRFGKVMSTGDPVDNLDLDVLLRPELPEHCLLLEF